MLTRLVSTLTLLALIAGCNLSGPTDVAMPANGLLMSLAVPGPCLVGGCDPVSGEYNHLGLITLTNTGAQSVFVRLCGTLPAFATQQYLNGKWVNVGPAVSCAFGPTSMVVAPGDSVRYNSFFALGIWRMSVGAATDTALVTETVSFSAPVFVK